MLTISCIYALRLLVLKLQTRFNFLHRLLIDTIYTAALANFCISILKNMNLSISQGYFDIAKSVNAALQTFWSNI